MDRRAASEDALWFRARETRLFSLGVLAITEEMLFVFLFMRVEQSLAEIIGDQQQKQRDYSVFCRKAEYALINGAASHDVIVLETCSFSTDGENAVQQYANALSGETISWDQKTPANNDRKRQEKKTTAPLWIS